MHRHLACFALAIGMWSVTVFGQQLPSTSGAGNPPRTQRPGGDPGARPSGQNNAAGLTNADVIRMVKAGVPDSAIIASIHSRPAKFDLSPEALVVLHKEGVSEQILEVMIAVGRNQGNASGSGGGTQAGKAGNSTTAKTPPDIVRPKDAFKPTPEQSKAALAKVKSKAGKVATVTATRTTPQAEAAVLAALQQQKNSVQSGKIMAAPGDPTGGQSTPPAGTPGAAGNPNGSPGGGTNPNNPNPNNPNSNNPAGGQNPSGGSSPRTAGGSSKPVSAATAAVAPSVRTAAPVNSGSPASHMASLGAANSKIDACVIPGLPPGIKGINSEGNLQGYSLAGVFSQEPLYNPFWLIGCHFGNTPGRAYLLSSSGQKIADLQVSSAGDWTDTLIKATLDPSLVNVMDQDNITLVIVSSAGQQGQKSGFKFYARRVEYLLPTIPQGQVALAQITDTGGKGVPPWYSSPYQGTWYSESIQTGNSQAQVMAQGLNADQGWTAGADRNAWYRFGGGTDLYDLSKLKAGFYFSRLQIDERTIAVCFGPNGFYFDISLPGETDYNDGVWNAQYNQVENKIHVDFAEKHCHVSDGGSDSSNSTYAINVWVKGPAVSANSNLWQDGVK